MPEDKNIVTVDKLNALVKHVTEALIKQVLVAKAEDYAVGTTDRLSNFKHQGRIDGVSPLQALRGNWLKHRASVQTALDEAEAGECRSVEWLEEKFGDSINYHILAYALILAEYHPDYLEKLLEGS
jgi:hypothetical protein